MSMDAERLERLKGVLQQVGLDALLLRLPENIVMTCGVWPMNGFSYGLVTAADGPVALVAPACEDQEMDDFWGSDVRYFGWARLDAPPDPHELITAHLRDIARTLKIERARIGYEGSFEAVAPPHNAGELLVPTERHRAYLAEVLPDVRWQDATDLLHGLRARKTPAEVERLRRSHRIASDGLRKFHQAVEPGVSEAQLAAVVYGECLNRGVETDGVRHVNVYPQISSGPNAHRAWRPIVTTGPRRLQDGQIALLELALCVDGFWADVTRIKVAGRPTTLQQDAFEAVRRAQQAATDTIKAGVPAARPHEVATELLRNLGMDQYMVHLTGHGLGFRYHEPEPFLMPGNDRPLEVGHVCSVEPGLYHESFGGIRIEDNVAVTEEGADVLTDAPKVI